MPYQNSPNDDLSGEYLNTRQNSEVTPYDELMMRERYKHQPFTYNLKRAINVFPTVAKGVAKDVVKGVAESPGQVVGGAFDAVKETGKTVGSLADLLNAPSVLRLTNEAGEIDIGLMTQEEFTKQGGKFAIEAITPEKSETVTGGLVRGVAQFLTGWIPVTRALKGVGPATQTAQWVKSALAGAAVDFSMFDPFEKDIVDLVNKFPILDPLIPDYLNSDPNNNEIEERFKKAVKGLGLGVLSDSFFMAMKGMRAARIARKQSETAIEETADAATGPLAMKKIEPQDFNKMLRPNADKPLWGYGKKYKTGRIKAGEDRALNINFDRIDTTDDVKQIMEGIIKSNAKRINKARREVISNEELEQFAKELGMTPDDVVNWQQGRVPMPEEAVAARQIYTASAEHIYELSQKAKMGSDFDMIRFRRALAQHKAINLTVAGMASEAGRLLQSFNIIAKSNKEIERMIAESIEISGGRESTKTLAAMVEILGDRPNGAKKINDFANNLDKATKFDMIYEYWINGLLSNPATHVKNLLGGSIVNVWSLADRKLASWIGAAIDEQSIPAGEVNAMLFGMIKGAKDGFGLAWDVIKKGEPSDRFTKQEMSQYRSITAENLNIGGPYARWADLMGEFIRTPGRLLMAGDEYMKSVAYGGEIYAQAYREAWNKNLTGDAFARHVSKVIENPPKNIHLDAVDFSRYTTFTTPLGPGGKGLATAIRYSRIARVLVPFMRVSVNSMKFVGEHSPLAQLSPRIKAEIAAGGARRDLALAKIATGSIAFAVVADMAMSGIITDRGPANPTLFKRKWDTGWRPHAWHIGDKYIQLDQTDPIASFIMIGADTAKMLGQVEEQDAFNIATALSIAVAEDMVNKTYLRNLSEAITVFNRMEPDPEDPLKKVGAYGRRMAATLLPFSSGMAALERSIDPEVSAVNTVYEQLTSRYPIASRLNYTERNIYGELVELEGGIGLDIMSPFYYSTDRKDRVKDEVAKQQTFVQMPSKILDGVRLTTEEYDEYIKLYSGMNNPEVNYIPIKEYLLNTIDSPAYQNGTDGPNGTKSMMIKSVFETYRAAAKKVFYDRMDKFKVKVEIKQDQLKREMGIE